MKAPKEMPADEQKDYASNLFSQQGRELPEAAPDDDLVNRIVNKNFVPKQGNYVAPQAGSGPRSISDVIASLKTAEEDKDKPKNIHPSSAENTAAAKGAVYNRSNDTIFASQVEFKGTSAKEKAEVSKHGSEAVSKFYEAHDNKKLLYTDNKIKGTDMTSNLSEDEIAKVTAGQRNVGFITDVKPTEEKKLSIMDELKAMEDLNRIVGARLNTNIHAAEEETEGGSV